jgi:hypothetical protein
MNGRHIGLLLALASVAMAAAAGTAAADHDEPDAWTSAGDVDTYGVWDRTDVPGAYACPSVLYDAHVTLELLHPHPGDRVLISGQKTTADQAVATWEDPEVSIEYLSGGCGGTVEVTGLTVSGDLGYRLDGKR